MEEKYLKCQCGDTWMKYPIIKLPVADIWQSVVSIEELRGIPFKKTLADDIIQNGMRFPIMVVHTSYWDLCEAKRRYRKKICELPSDRFWAKDGADPKEIKIWSVWGGSQRLTFAREHEYTHIDCAVIPSIQESISLQKEMRRHYPKLYGKNK